MIYSAVEFEPRTGGRSIYIRPGIEPFPAFEEYRARASSGQHELDAWAEPMANGHFVTDLSRMMDHDIAHLTENLVAPEMMEPQVQFYSKLDDRFKISNGDLRIINRVFGEMDQPVPPNLYIRYFSGGRIITFISSTGLDAMAREIQLLYALRYDLLSLPPDFGDWTRGTVNNPFASFCSCENDQTPVFSGKRIPQPEFPRYTGEVSAEETPKKKKYKIVISDCHLSAGRFFEGRANPHEDFLHDDDMVYFFDHFSTGPYGSYADGAPVEVELILNGDYFDYLNVPVNGEFEESVTETMALGKTTAIMEGHPKVMQALKRFASRDGKRITYLVGNHDGELFFPKVREMITRAWDTDGKFPSEKVELVADRDRLTYEGGVEVRHGNQFEAGNAMDFDEPLLVDYVDEPILKMPWGSIYVLKIINRMKWERSYVDKVRPVKVFALFGLILDPWFTIRFLSLSLYYFLKTRIALIMQGRSKWGATMEILRQETQLFRDLESEARELLDARSDLRTVVFGHTHRPMDKVWPDGKQYINTGTWTRMINLDWSGLGQHLRRTFAYIEIDGTQSRCELREWVGEYQPHQVFQI